MRSLLATVASAALCLSAALLWAQAPDQLAIFKSGDYKSAMPLLRSALQANPADPQLRAHLLSALVYEGNLAESAAEAARDAKDFPANADILAARGEFAFYLGDMPEAERLFNEAARLNPQCARAVYGQYRLCKMASQFRTARLLCLRAHALDPDDALITAAYLGYLVPERQAELLPSFRAAHPWFNGRYAELAAATSDISAELGDRKPFDPVAPKTETTLHLIDLYDTPSHVRGVGLQFSLNGGRPLSLMLDTGASGILLTQSAIDQAGLKHVGSLQARGIGDEGPRKSFGSVADTCTVATLRYTNCYVRAISGRGRIAGSEDGLIGADFFQDYLVQLDFRNHQLHLTPFPDRPANPQGYDRSIPPSEAGFTPAFREGHFLFIITKMNDKCGLFLIDTGSSVSNVDATFARSATKIHNEAFESMRGISGEVKHVREVDEAVIQFANFRQRNIGLLAIDLNTPSEDGDPRASGILGFPVLKLFRLTLDYRNGLVNFDYVPR